MGEEKQQWHVVVGRCATPGGEDRIVYGVAVTCADGTVWHWWDVADHRAAAEQLAERLQQAQPERCHWAEIVVDFITGLSL